MEEALPILRAALPAGHPNIAISLSNLAKLHEAKGDYGAAQPLLEEVLERRHLLLEDSDAVHIRQLPRGRR